LAGKNLNQHRSRTDNLIAACKQDRRQWQDACLRVAVPVRKWHPFPGNLSHAVCCKISGKPLKQGIYSHLKKTSTFYKRRSPGLPRRSGYAANFHYQYQGYVN